jgi:DNA uptake protein ComE-like DNA-binding protein
MKLKTAIGLGIGFGAAFAAIVLVLRPKRRPLEISSEDLRYQEHSAAELRSEHLLDLNTASLDDFLGLGLDTSIADQIVDNRPYRNKMDLLSRMVMPEAAYDQIKHRIGVAEATQPIKVGS